MLLPTPQPHQLQGSQWRQNGECCPHCEPCQLWDSSSSRNWCRGTLGSQSQAPPPLIRDSFLSWSSVAALEHFNKFADTLRLCCWGKWRLVSSAVSRILWHDDHSAGDGIQIYAFLAEDGIPQGKYLLPMACRVIWSSLWIRGFSNIQQQASAVIFAMGKNDGGGQFPHATVGKSGSWFLAPAILWSKLAYLGLRSKTVAKCCHRLWIIKVQGGFSNSKKEKVFSHGLKFLWDVWYSACAMLEISTAPCKQQL